MASTEDTMATGYEDERFQTFVPENLHCDICFNVLKDAMQCEKNEHSFCSPCITRHLQNTTRCPTCIEPLTLQSVRPSRFVREMVSQLMIQCDNVDRGCPDIVKVEMLDRHIAICGFSPVYCSNDGCRLLINRRNKENHEINQCEFRKGRCNVCGFEVTRDEITQMKKTLENFTTESSEMRKQMRVMEINMERISERMNTLERLVMENIGKQVQLQAQDETCFTISQEAPTGENFTIRENIFAVGGTLWNSGETFNWSTNEWAHLPSITKERKFACSFVHQGKFFVVGRSFDGKRDDCDIEALDLKERDAKWKELPCKLPMRVEGFSCVVYQGNLYIFGGDSDGKISDNIYKLSLSPPYVCKLIGHMPEPRAYHGAHLFGSKVVIVGGTTDSNKYCLDSVIEFNTSNHVCRPLPSLPYPVCKMATVAWKDNIVVIGGHDGKLSDLDTVVIYNIRSGKSSMLPRMKEKRLGCSAVVTDNVIVVMGGRKEVISLSLPLLEERIPIIRELSSVECFDFCRYKWKELPSMNQIKFAVTAVVSNF